MLAADRDEGEAETLVNQRSTIKSGITSALVYAAGRLFLSVFVAMCLLLIGRREKQRL